MKTSDVELAILAEHGVGGDGAVILVGDGLVGPPVERRREQRLPRFEEVGDGELERARTSRSRHGERVLGHLRAGEDVGDDRLVEGRRARERRVARRLHRRHRAQRIDHRRKDGELAVVVEERAHRGVDDGLALGAASGRLRIEGEDRVVGRPRGAGGDQELHWGRGMAQSKEGSKMARAIA